MRKVKLQVEELAVDSFHTTASAGRGTVMGRIDAIGKEVGTYPQPATYPECPSPLCVDTPLASCDGSCRPGCVAHDTPAPVEG